MRLTGRASLLLLLRRCAHTRCCAAASAAPTTAASAGYVRAAAAVALAAGGGGPHDQHLLALVRQQARRPVAQPAFEQRLLAALQRAPSVPREQLLPLMGAAAALWQQQQQAPSARLLQALTASALAALPQLPAQQFAAVLAGLADCEAAVAAAAAAAAGPAQQAARHAAGAAPTPALGKAVTAYLQQQGGRLDAAALVAVATALARHPQRSAGGSWVVLCMLAVEHVPAMDARQLAALLAACAAAQHHNAAVCGAAARLAAQQLQRQGYRLLPDAAAEQGFAAGQLAALLRALASLRHDDAQLLEAACTAVLRSLAAGRVPLAHAVAVAKACAALNHYNPQLFDAATQLAQHAMDGAGAPHVGGGADSGAELQRAQAVALSDLAWAAAVLGHWDAALWQQLTAWSAGVDAAALPRAQLVQWFQVQTALTDAAVQRPELRACGLANQLLLAAQAAWARQLQGKRLTRFHKEVSEALQQAGVRCSLNVALDGPLVVDIALRQRQVGQRLRTALCLDGPDAFAANPPHAPLGPTAARWRALQARSWQVVSLRYMDWRRLKREERLGLAFSLRDGVPAGAAAPGAPAVAQVGRAAPQPAEPPGGLTRTLWRLFIEG